MPLRRRTILARKLRENATDVERILWGALRESTLPWKFRRQPKANAQCAFVRGGASDCAAIARAARCGLSRLQEQPLAPACDDASRRADLSPTLSAPRGGEGDKRLRRRFGSRGRRTQLPGRRVGGRL